MPKTKYRTERQARAAQQRNLAKWQKANCRNVMCRFFIKSDEDVLAKLDSVPNKTDYIRRLIREDIARNGNE